MLAESSAPPQEASTTETVLPEKKFTVGDMVFISWQQSYIQGKIESEGPQGQWRISYQIDGEEYTDDFNEDLISWDPQTTLSEMQQKMLTAIVQRIRQPTTDQDEAFMRNYPNQV